MRRFRQVFLIEFEEFWVVCQYIAKILHVMAGCGVGLALPDFRSASSRPLARTFAITPNARTLKDIQRLFTNFICDDYRRKRSPMNNYCLNMLQDKLQILSLSASI